MVKKGQTWSFDLIVAVVLFVVVIGLFYGFVLKEDDTTDKLQESTKKINYKLDCKYVENEDHCVLENGVIDGDGLKALYTYRNYDVVKDLWDVDEDFCIYLRDLEGNLIPVGEKTSFGSTDLVLTQDGKRCSAYVEGYVPGDNPN